MQRIKRLTGSRFHLINAQKKYKKSHGGYAIVERQVATEFFLMVAYAIAPKTPIDLKEVFLQEAGIYPPKYPHLGSNLDAIAFTSVGNVIVEFKGIMAPPCLEIDGPLWKLPDYIQQIIFYSFLTEWKDVLFVWGEFESGIRPTKAAHRYIGAAAVMKHHYFPFSQTKPYQAEIQKNVLNSYVDYFMRHIWVPRFHKKPKDSSRKAEKIEKNF